MASLPHGYRGYDELRTAITSLKQRGAHCCAIGQTVRGLDIHAVRIGNRDARATTLIIAGLHPIEWIGVEVAFALLERLIDDPPRRQILCVPVVNVDGYREVETDLRTGRRRWVRTNARGVDLNRNWPVGFLRQKAIFRAAGTSGSSPFSEPETAAVRDLAEHAAASSALDVMLSLHSIGRTLLVPWGHRIAAPAAKHDMVGRAQAVASRLSKRYSIRQVSRWLPGVRVRGMEIDYFHHRFGSHALLAECTLGGVRLRSPRSWTRPFCWYNPRDLHRRATELAAALHPFVANETSTMDGTQ